MITEDQTPVIQFLESHLSSAGAPAGRIETHSAVVFLAGTRAWKLKRAVLFDYLDFSTPGRRRQMCEAELALNRRTAPQLYHRVVPITRESSGTLALGGSGTPIDWVIEMTRFDQELLCDRLAAAGRLQIDDMSALAYAIAGFHAAAARRPDHGGAASMRWVTEGNAAGFAEFGASFMDAARRERVLATTSQLVTRYAELLDQRRQNGFVRQCHGDLHLRNIVLLDGQPTLFDAIEFNDELACIDVWYDVAFLLMDLASRRLPGHANVVFNRYLERSDDVEGLALLPLFLACRAAIRAKTSATSASMQRDARMRDQFRATSVRYLAMAETLLDSDQPALIAVGGLSGSGKSTLARSLAPDVGRAPGAVLLRSDEIRKDLCGVPRLTRLQPDAYTPEMSAQVYSILQERATRILATGHSVIADAVFAKPETREAIERAASAASVRFVGLWLDAPESVLVHRTTARQHDASDADAHVVRAQLAESTGTIHWLRLDASAPPRDVLRVARERLSDVQ